MKKYLLFSVASLMAISSCTSNVEDESQINKEITFQVANFSSQTKAYPENTSAYNTSNSFGAYAWYYQEGQSYSSDPTMAQPFMSNEKVSYASSEWKPAHTYYWPKSGKIDFISVSPWKETSLFNVTQNKVSLASYDITKQEDLMYADKAIERTANVTTYGFSGVPTLFHHALAKVNFMVKQSETSNMGSQWTIAVKSLKVSGLAPTGSAEFNLFTDGKTWTLPSATEPGSSVSGEALWTADYTEANRIYKEWTNTTPVTAEGKTIKGMKLTTTAENYTTGSATATNYMVIPQWLKYVKFTLIYDIVTKLPNGSVLVQNDVKGEVVASTANIKFWQINKNYTYTFTISGSTLTPITFDPAVKNWEDVSGQTISI